MQAKKIFLLEPALKNIRWGRGTCPDCRFGISKQAQNVKIMVCKCKSVCMKY